MNFNFYIWTTKKKRFQQFKVVILVHFTVLFNFINDIMKLYSFAVFKSHNFEIKKFVFLNLPMSKSR